MPSSAIVVGAGVLGCAVADRLARSGWQVTLVERIVPGHVRAGSGGETRLLRCCHGDDAWHTRSARRARELWLDLDPRLLVECGVLWFARGEAGWEAASENVLAAEGIPVERVDPRNWFPSVRDDDLSFALLEPEAGVLRAREATMALARRAQSAGAALVHDEAVPRGERVLLGSGDELEADRVVWACGAWLPALFPGLLDLRITQQDVFFFGATAAWRSPGVPGWVDYDGAAYGVGDVDGRGVKVAPDVEGPPLDPERAERVTLPEHLALARHALAHRFPALAEAPLVGTRTCQYELTADTRFVCAPHPEHGDRVWLLGGGSGHAFKHAPALAERAERWLSGEEPPDASLGLGARAPAIKLRTAGAS